MVQSETLSVGIRLCILRYDNGVFAGSAGGFVAVGVLSLSRSAVETPRSQSGQLGGAGCFYDPGGEAAGGQRRALVMPARALALLEQAVEK